MNMPGALWWSWGGGLFRMSEVTLYTDSVCRTDMGTLQVKSRHPPRTSVDPLQEYLDYMKTPHPPRTVTGPWA